MNAAVKISTLQEVFLQVGEAYKHPISQSHSAQLRELVDKNSDIYICEDFTVFTTNVSSPSFGTARALLKKLHNTLNFIGVEEAVMSALRAFLAANDGVAVQNVSDRKQSVVSTDESPAEILFKQIIEAASKKGASDIHIKIPGLNEQAQVYIRVDGHLKRFEEFHNFPTEKIISMMNAAVNWTAQMKGGDSTKSFSLSMPTDAKIQVTLDDGSTLQIRLGVMPGHTENYGKCVLRLLADKGKGNTLTLEQLGFNVEQCALIREALRIPYGAFLFTGPTGSGKSTGIASALSEIDESRAINGIENPIENVIYSPTAIQSTVNEGVEELQSSSLLRSVLRCDPDIVMVGELRDTEVTAIAARAAQTGHLLLSTLHTNTALEIPQSLEYYGLPLHTITDMSFLRYAVAQRLVPMLCGKCKIRFVDFQLPQNSRSDLKYQFTRIQGYFAKYLDSIYVHNSNGCKDCGGSGYKGRALIAEVIKIDNVARKYILARDNQGWYRSLKERGWRDMKDHAEDRVKSGIVCPFEVEHELLTPFGVDSVEDTVNYTEFRNNLASV